MITKVQVYMKNTSLHTKKLELNNNITNIIMFVLAILLTLILVQV